MAYCKNCGSFTVDDAAVCQICGVGKGMGSSFCPNCGAQAMPGAANCTRCGSALEQAPAAPVYEAQQQQYAQPPQYDQQYAQPQPPQYDQQQYAQQQYAQQQQQYAQPQYGQQQYGQQQYAQPQAGQAYEGQPPPPGYEQKSKMIAGLLGIFLGVFGAGRFYLGYTKTGVTQLVVSLVTCGIGSLWGLIDGVMILTGSVKVDGQGFPLKD